MATNDPLRKTVNDILAGLPFSKAASDPKTSHPSGSAPDGNSDTSMGAPGRETESTLKKDEPLGVPHATPSPAEPVDDDTQLGIQAKPLGKDPAVEDDYKDKKDDPGTSLSQTSTENAAGRAGKYASAIANLTKAAQTVLLAVEGEVKGAGAPAPAAAAPAAAPVKPQTPSPAKTAAEAEKTAAEEAAGIDLAEVLLGAPLSQQKRAEAENAMITKVAECVRFGESLGNEYADYLRGLVSGAEKAANEAAMAEAAAAGGDPMAGQGAPPPGAEGGMPPEAGGMPPGAGGAPPGAGGQIPPELLAEIMALLQGGEQMPGTSMEQMLGGGGGGGGAPPGAGGEGGESPEMAALVEAAMAQEGGAGPEGMPPEQAKAAGLRKAASILAKQSAKTRRMYPAVRATLRELART